MSGAFVFVTGVTGLFIASKLEEIYPPNGTDFANTTADTYSANLLEVRNQPLCFLCGNPDNPDNLITPINPIIPTTHRVTQTVGTRFSVE